jgi:hypothetical protein
MFVHKAVSFALGYHLKISDGAQLNDQCFFFFFHSYCTQNVSEPFSSVLHWMSMVCGREKLHEKEVGTICPKLYRGVRT